MKKIIIAVISLFAVAVVASAQPRAIGGRAGWGMEVSYQHTLGGENFIEADLGLGTFNAFNAVATYNFMIAQPSWTPKGEWGFYAGPGAALTAGFTGYGAFGFVANVGLEYTFWFPLQLSVDLRPQLGVAFDSNSAAFYTPGLYGLVPSLSVRYRF